MKKVITDNQDQFTLTRDASVDFYYGVEYGEYRGFVTKVNENFTIRYLKELTTGYGSNSHNFHKFQDFLEDVISCGGYTVYEFATYKELVSWLLGGK